MRWLLPAMMIMTACRSGGAIPPSRLDVAPVTMTAGGESHVGSHVAYGLHWASLSPSHKTQTDVGLGYIYQRFGDEDVSQLKSADPRNEYRVTRALNVHALYLETDSRIGYGDNHRTWAGVRGEALFGHVDGETQWGAGVTGRLSWELYGTIKDRSAMGAFAIGAFIEGGARLLPDRRAGAQTLGGLTVRLPAIASK